MAALDEEAIAVFGVALPWGPAAVGVGADGVHALALLATESDVARSVARRTGRPVVPLAKAPNGVAIVAHGFQDELRRYASTRRRRSFDGWHSHVRLAGLSDWDRRILEAVRRIPFGSTSSYGAIARAAGSPGAARAAGGSVGRNPVGLLVPCHRVIAGDGSIGGYGGSWPADRDALVDLKRALLAHEGVTIG